MINSSNIDVDKIASHYNELDPFYRDIWGQHVHHGYWKKGSETIEEATKALVDLMLENLNLQSGAEVCDVGCGYGETSRLLASNQNCQVTSFTISQKQYDFAMKLTPINKNPRFLLQDWLQNELRDECMDAVIAIESTEHMPDFNQFFVEAQRVLKPGGRLAIFAWLQAPEVSSWEKKFLLQPVCDEGRMRLGTVEDYEQYILKNKMVVERVKLISEKVSRTWTLCIQRSLGRIFSDRRYRKYLMSKEVKNREFLKTLFRIRMAFSTGAMEYGLFIAKKA